MIKGIVKSAVALSVVTGAFLGTHPVYEKNFIRDNETVTVSWDFVDDHEKHFSVEHFIDGDINDAFVISKVHNNWNDVMEWNVWNVEFWKNVDDFWFNIEIGK